MKSIKINNMPDLPYAMEEAVNRLRINISFLGTKIKKIMIISTEPNEGKSFVAMQLWKQIAEAGTPSILLDADMRKSVMADKYEIVSEKKEEIKGLSHYLSSDTRLRRQFSIPNGKMEIFYPTLIMLLTRRCYWRVIALKKC